MEQHLFILQFRSKEGRKLFKKESDYLAFLEIYEKRIAAHLSTYAWSLLPEKGLVLAGNTEDKTHAISYAGQMEKHYNRYYRKRYRMNPGMEKKVVHLARPRQETLNHTIVRMHCMPLLQGHGNNFVEYPWTSYLLLLGEKHTGLQAEKVMKWFGGKRLFREEHHAFLDKNVGEVESQGENFVRFMVEKDQQCGLN